MSLLRRSRVAALALVILLPACRENEPLGPHERDPGKQTPSFTPGSGSTPTLLGRATFADPTGQTFKVKRMTGDWHVEIKGKPAIDLAIQSIRFDAGGQSGWHSHPGPVFIQVVSGTMTFYESDDPECTPIVRTAGQSYLDVGEHAHIARNETAAPAENVVTYFAPPGAALRIDQPSPGNCPF
jgi:cupin domain